MCDGINQVNIRLMREADLPAIEWDGEYSRYRRIYQEIFRNSKRGISAMLAAEMPEEGIIGQIFLTKKEPNPEYSPYHSYGFISSFRVKPAFQDRGLGGRLLEACEKKAVRMYIKDIFLNCAAENNRAKVFYERHGYQVQRINSGEWTYIDPDGRVVSEFQTAYLMKKTLWTVWPEDEPMAPEKDIAL